MACSPRLAASSHDVIRWNWAEDRFHLAPVTGARRVIDVDAWTSFIRSGGEPADSGAGLAVIPDILAEVGACIPPWLWHASDRHTRLLTAPSRWRIDHPVRSATCRARLNDKQVPAARHDESCGKIAVTNHSLESQCRPAELTQQSSDLSYDLSPLMKFRCAARR
jgi:hypothetical protein